MKRKKIMAMLLCMSMAAGMLSSTSVMAASDPFAEKLHEMYDEVETEYRPGVRWWLAEGLNTDETLDKNIQEIHDNGFGAAEFLAMPEPSADSSIYGWGSEEWTNDTMRIIKKATELGLGFSVTSGTNWANANLLDTYTYDGEPFNPDNKAASQVLDYATVYLNAGEQFNGELPKSIISSAEEEGSTSDMHSSNGAFTKQTFEGAVVAKVIQGREGAGEDYAEGTGTGVIDFSTLTDVTEDVKEENGVYTLDWQAPDDGQYALLVYWMHGSSQTATPSVSTNYTVNYIDTYGMEAVIDYWENVILTDEMREAIKENGKGEIYMDSLELRTEGAGGILWGYNFKEEFKNRKGYDITPYLPLITEPVSATRTTADPIEYDYTVEGEENLQFAEKVRNDFYDVSSALYVENVLKPLQEWLHSIGMTLRAEPSYGMYFEISTPGKYLDDVETESFAQNADVDLFRGLLGSANMYNVPLSSETGAIWYNTEPSNYTRPMDDWTQLCYLQFANGVSRTVFHGYSAIEGSEGDTQWPGHEGMYAYCTGRWNSRQPAAKDFQDFTDMLSRNQKVLRQGTPSRDIAVLRTDYSYYNYGYEDGKDTPYYNNQMYDEPYYFSDESLQQAGYTYDYFSPQLLEDEENVSWDSTALQPDGAAYQALIVYQETLEKSSAEKLLQIAKDGLPIVFVNNNDETLTLTGEKYHNGEAGSRSKFVNDSDEEVKAITDQMKELDNVVVAESPEGALEALQSVGVYPRVTFTEPNNKILTISRNDAENNIYYTYAYSYKAEVSRDEEPYTFTMDIAKEGAPYTINDWTGEVTKLGDYEIKDGHTFVTVTLQPGESTIVALDLNASAEDTVHAVSVSEAKAEIIDDTLTLVAEKSGDYDTTLSTGETVTTSVTVPDPITLTDFDITIEDWNAGDKVVNKEEKFGHETTEVYYETKKTSLTFENSKLVPWKDLPATQEQLDSLGYENAEMKDVSGIGTYETTFTLPDDWTGSNGAYLQLDNANGGSVAVYVNGEKADGVNTRTLKVDVSKLVKAGENTLKIEVATSLYNRLVQRDYYNFLGDDLDLEAYEYGLTGNVTIVPYTMSEIQ